MTTTQFLDDLEKELKGRKISRKDIEAAREFYDEAIANRLDSGMSEDEAIADLGSIEDIARIIYEENPPIKKTIGGMSIPTLVLFIVLLLLSSVFWIPFLASFLMMLVFLALTPVGAELILLNTGIDLLWDTILAFYRGQGNLSVWFLTLIGVAIIGLAISFIPLIYRVAELEGRGLARGIYYLTRFFSKRTQTRKMSWYRPVFKWRKFDKIVLTAGGIIAGIGILGAFGIWASTGFDIDALSTANPLYIYSKYMVIDHDKWYIGGY